MLKISSKQMATLSANRKLAFLTRLYSFLTEKTGRQPAQGILGELFDRGCGYGLVAEQDLAGYVAMAWMAGVHPPAPDHGWIADILSDPYRLPEDKVAALFELAKRKQRERS